MPSCSSTCAGATCGATLLDRWVTYDRSGVWNVASTVFEANHPSQFESVEVDKVNAYDDRSSPYYPSVVFEGTGTVSSLFAEMKFFGKQVFPNQYNVDVCSQGFTSYRPSTGDKDWIAPPRLDACRK